MEQLDEYVLFDFNAIIATIGGSLGLFLGLSFADIAVTIFSFLLERISKRCNKSKENRSARTIKCAPNEVPNF